MKITYEFWLLEKGKWYLPASRYYTHPDKATLEATALCIKKGHGKYMLKAFIDSVHSEALSMRPYN